MPGEEIGKQSKRDTGGPTRSEPAAPGSNGPDGLPTTALAAAPGPDNAPGPAATPGPKMSLGKRMRSAAEPFDGMFVRPRPNVRYEAALVTWSSVTPGKQGIWKSPGAKEDFLEILGDAIEASTRVEVGNIRIAIFREPHREKSGARAYHLHAAISARTCAYGRLAQQLAAKGIGVDVRVPAVPSGNVSLFGRMLRYLFVPTATKWLVDTAPLLYPPNGSIAPEALIDEREKAIQRLQNRPATLDDLFHFLVAHPEIGDASLLDRFVVSALARKTENSPLELAPYKRLQLMVARHGKAFGAEFQAQARRVRELLLDPSMTMRDWHKRALAHACTCDREGAKRESLKKGVQWHDDKEYYLPPTTSREILGRWYHLVLTGGFPDRRTALLALGAAGSGKSTVARAVFDWFLPDHENGLSFRNAYVFKPAWDDTFVWTNCSETAKFLDFNDFRMSDAASPTTVLTVCEQDRSVTLAQKNGPPISFKSPPLTVITSNYLRPSGKWKEDDVAALQDRVFLGGIRWAHALPEELVGNAGRMACGRCSAQFASWCMEVAAGIPAGRKAVEGGEGAGATQVPVSNPARCPVDLHEGAKSGVKSQDVDLSGVPVYDNTGEPEEFFGDEDPSVAVLGFDDP